MCPEYKKHITRDDKMAQETILDILKEFTTSNRQSIGQIMYVKKLCKARGEKKKTNKIKGNNNQSTHMVGHNFCSLQSEW